MTLWSCVEQSVFGTIDVSFEIEFTLLGLDMVRLW